MAAKDEPVRREGELNQVRLRGRWAETLMRELPSGDVLVSARLVVSRAPPATGVDTAVRMTLVAASSHGCAGARTGVPAWRG